MAKQTGDADDLREPQTTMKVFKPEAVQWNRLAALRGVSIAELMRQEDVSDFVSHLILHEAKRIQTEAGRKKR